jgi:hypothetical protein
LYESGYIELAALAYTDDLSAPLAHVTNLSPVAGKEARGVAGALRRGGCHALREGGGGAGAGPFYRQWTSEEYVRCLTEGVSVSENEERLGRQVLSLLSFLVFLVQKYRY